ncbi:MAG: DUF4339 domain-containing protein [Planctomycetes bacterium]|nr:DUF4339 domain-containing protein [Planctomycetota bacterium]
MGIRFACQQCGHAMHVKDFLAGKRGICDQCQARVDIPLQSTIEKVKTAEGTIYRPVAAPQGGANAQMAGESATTMAAPTDTAQGAALQPTTAYAPAETAHAQPAALTAPSGKPAATPHDPIDEKPAAVWYVLPPGGTTQYGPAPGTLFRVWIDQGRVGPESMIWREDWPEWRRAAEVLPQMSALTLPPSGIALATPIGQTVWSDPVARTPATPNIPASVLAKGEYRLEQRRRSTWLWAGLAVLLIAAVGLAAVMMRIYS